MNASNLKNPGQYDEFVLALQKILIRFAIKMDSCLVAEEDGHIVSAAIYSIRRLNGICKVCIKGQSFNDFSFQEGVHTGQVREAGDQPHAAAGHSGLSGAGGLHHPPPRSWHHHQPPCAERPDPHGH